MTDRAFLTCRVEIFRDIKCFAIIAYTISRQKLANKASFCVKSDKYTSPICNSTYTFGAKPSLYQNSHTAHTTVERSNN